MNGENLERIYIAETKRLSKFWSGEGNKKKGDQYFTSEA